jgi:hypothetical protein
MKGDAKPPTQQPINVSWQQIPFTWVTKEGVGTISATSHITGAAAAASFWELLEVAMRVTSAVLKECGVSGGRRQGTRMGGQQEEHH